MHRPVAQPWMNWPGQCELCRRWSHGRLCTDCAPAEDPAAALLRCTGCGLRLQGLAESARCGTCLAHPLPFVRCLCATDYLAPWDRLIVAFKYHGALDLAPALAQRLSAAVAEGPGNDVDLVVPMPLAPRRLAERGYNQAWELARRVSRRLGRRAHAGLLSRPLDRTPQAGLDRAARRRNLQGAFAVPNAALVAGRHIAIVDDVLTTGATAAEATQTLLAAGAASVQVWVLARTP